MEPRDKRILGYDRAFGLLGIQLGLLQQSLFQALPERIWGVMSNDTLLAVPFFTFMGLILERSGMAEDLLDTIGQLFGPMRGGLADQLGRSVGDMYAGAFIPGLALAGLYAVYAVGVTMLRPQWAPALPLEARTLWIWLK